MRHVMRSLRWRRLGYSLYSKVFLISYIYCIWCGNSPLEQSRRRPYRFFCRITPRMESEPSKRLRPAEVEMILRRAAELNARRWSRDSNDTPSISSEVLVQVAAAAGIPEQD